MNERLKQFLAAENITQSQFADSIKVARASVTHILSGRNKPGFDFISNTMMRYPELNMDWLLNGKGKMYSKVGATVPNEPKESELFSTFGSNEDFVSEKPEQPQDIPVTSRREENIGMVSHTDDAKIEFSEDKQKESELEKAIQPIVNQRKAVKIIIFFDDGTFQEF